MKLKTKNTLLLFLLVCTGCFFISCQGNKETNGTVVIESPYLETMKKPEIIDISNDIYLTNKGELNVSVLGHASLVFNYKGKYIYVDPYSEVTDYTNKPKADLILITHEHYDHLDSLAISLIKKDGTQFIVSQSVKDTLGYGEVLRNGESTVFDSIPIQAVPAYNMVNKRENGEFYHPKGRGNGYILTFGDKNVYIAGDTENIPEMKALKDIYIAFLPKNLPYTMTDEMFVDAAKTVHPEYLYPYHFSEFNLKKIEKELNDPTIVFQVRPMKTKADSVK